VKLELKIMRSLIASVGILATSFASYAQPDVNGGPINVPVEGVIDGIVIQEHVPTKKMIPYEHVREADMIWSKRVWRSIDMREKMNHTLYFPFDEFSPDGTTWTRNSSRWSLWTVIRTNIINANVQVYYPFNPVQQASVDGDQFKYPVAVQPGKNFYTDSLYAKSLVEFQVLGAEEEGALIPIPSRIPPYEDSVIQMPNGDLLVQYEPRKVIWVTSKDIVQYRLKEDWFFDKERSMLDKRIIAIAPVANFTVDKTKGSGRGSLLIWDPTAQTPTLLANVGGTKTNISGNVETAEYELFWLYSQMDQSVIQCRR
jgi:hypothetical protein